MVELIRALVRPIVTISLTLLIIYLSIVGLIEPRELMGIYGTVLGFWFGQRSPPVANGA